MKYFLLVVLLLFFLPTNASAFTKTETSPDVSITISGNHTVADIDVNAGVYSAFSQAKVPVAGIKVWSSNDITKKPIFESIDLSQASRQQAQHIYHVTNLIPTTTYYYQYFLYKERRSTNSVNRVEAYAEAYPQVFSFTTDDKEVVYFEKLVQTTEGDRVLFIGKIDPQKYSNYDLKKFKVVMYKGDKPDYALKEERPYTTEGGIKDDGTYTIPAYTSDFTPGAVYYFWQVITTPYSTTVVDGPYKYKEGSGIIPLAGTEAQDDFDNRSYRLLAPIPGLTVLLDPDLCMELKNEGKPTNGLCDLNDFINLALKMLIGFVALLLVFKIMLEGYNYIVSDIPKFKASSKVRLIESVSGLALALSSFIILNTINPKLVENTIDLEQIAVGVEEDIDISPIFRDDLSGLKKGAVAACTEGIEKVTIKNGDVVGACKRISSNLKSMLDLAWSQGIKLSGGGYRSSKQQIDLRIAHCGGNSNYNIYQKPSNQCSPPTARPGKSRHESGLAFDLTCDGQSIRARDNKCFIWLSANAARFGLKNFSKEPWHWSIDGN